MIWKTTIDNVALAALIFAVVAISAISAVAVVSVENLIAVNEQILRMQRAISSLEAIRYHAVALDAGEQNYIVTGKSRDLTPFHASVVELRAELLYLNDKRTDLANLAENFTELQNTIDRLIEKEGQIVDSRQKLGFAAAQELTQQHIADGLHEKLAGLTYRTLTSARTQLERLEADQIAFGDKVRRLITALISSSAFILIFLYGTLRRLNLEQRAAQARMTYQATHDELTGLHNRLAVMDHLNSQIEDDATIALGGMALLLIDLDGFKAVNDNLGHDAGDALLKEVAGRVTKALRESDYIARLGGDEFLVVIPQVSDRETAERVAEKLVRMLGQPYSAISSNAQVTCSIGISLFPKDGRDRETLMKSADLALYEAKNAGRNGFRFFEAAMRDA